MGTVIITPAGEKLLYLKGNRNSEIQDVLVNKDGEFSLVSVGKYLKDNPKSSIIFTKKGAYEINNVEPENKVETIHKRLGHISPENMKQLRKNGWIDFSDADMKRFESSPCDGCLKATYNQKHSGHKRRDAKTRNARRSTEKGHWHCDLMILTGNSKFKRALIMVEERSRFTHISFTTETFNEEEAEYLFEALKETIEANGNEIKSLRWDGESAIWDTAFKKWCNERQIRLDRSASGEQNG